MPSQTKNQTKTKVVEQAPATPVEPVKQTGGKNMKGGKKPTQSTKNMKGGKKTAQLEPVVQPEPLEQPELVTPSEPVAQPEPVVQQTQKGGKKQVRQAKGGKSKVQKATKMSKTTKDTKGGKSDDEKEEETGDKRMRSFKVRLPGDEDFSGRFTGLTPYQAANKALSKFYRDNKESNATVVTFTIKESTRGSKRSEYVYNGKREKLAEPVKYPIQNKEGEVKTITKSFKNKLTKVKKTELASLTASA